MGVTSVSEGRGKKGGEVASEPQEEEEEEGGTVAVRKIARDLPGTVQ